MARTETTAAPLKERQLQKVSAKQINVSLEKPGFTFEGYYVGVVESAYVDHSTGEEKGLRTLIIENDQKERTKMLADKGLMQSLADGMITKGDWFKAVKGEKANIGKGRTMNTWDVYTEFKS